MQRFALLADDEGFDVLVVVFPQFGQLPERKLVKYDRVAGYSEDNAFGHLDLRTALDECGELSELSNDIFHPNGEGHACAAGAIAAYLENRVLVAAAP